MDLKDLKMGYIYCPDGKGDPFYFDGQKIVRLLPDENGKWILPDSENIVAGKKDKRQNKGNTL